MKGEAVFNMYSTEKYITRNLISKRQFLVEVELWPSGKFDNFSSVNHYGPLLALDCKLEVSWGLCWEYHLNCKNGKGIKNTIINGSSLFNCPSVP